MIPWRYHLVSIMAIFLALGLGVVVGTTVINPGLVKNLNNQTDGLRQELRDRGRDVIDLRSQLDTMNAFSDEALPFLVADTLVGRQVVFVIQEGVDAGAIAEARRAVDLSGTEVLTVLTVRSTMAAETPATQRDLATLLGLSEITPPDELVTEAALALAQRLAKDPGGGPSATPDPLDGLLSQGFLTSSSPAISTTTLNEVGGRGQIVVAIGGGAIDELSPASSAFMEPFVAALVSAGVVTGAGESLAAEDGFVERLRSSIDDASGAPLVTVDNVDLPVGGAALVLGLDVGVSQGTGGDYGVKDGSSRLLPPAA